MAQTRELKWIDVERDEFERVVGLTGTASDWEAVEGRRRLLVAVDGSPCSARALALAAQLARICDAFELHLVNVQAFPGNQPDDSALEDWGLAACEQALAFLAEHALPYLLHIAAGDPVQRIVDYAEAAEVDEILMGSRGLGRWEKLLLGSVASGVLEQSLVPVTVVKSDDSDASPVAAPWLLACDGSQFALRAAQYIVDYGHCGVRPRVEVVTVHEGGSQAAGPHADATRALLEEASLECRFHERAGEAASTLMRAAEEYGCGRIVMGTRGLGTLGRLVLGSVAAKIVQGAPIPVTAVK